MKQIIAMGGGGFSMEPDNLALDRYVLAQTGKQRPKICFVPTASGDSPVYIDSFYAAFRTLDCEPTHLSLFRGETPEIASFLLSQDAIYVGGGNTRNMLVIWKEWGVDRILRQAWEQGIVLAGISAGSLCWFEEGVTDSIPGSLNALTCMGFLPGSNCPHYDGEADRRPSYHRLLANGDLRAGWACDDGVALHYVGTELHQIISSRPEAKAYQLSLGPDGVQEHTVTPRSLLS